MRALLFALLTLWASVLASLWGLPLSLKGLNYWFIRSLRFIWREKKQIYHIRAPGGFGEHPRARSLFLTALTGWIWFTRHAKNDGCATSSRHRKPEESNRHFRLCKLVTTQINQIFINSLVNRNSSIMVSKYYGCQRVEMRQKRAFINNCCDTTLNVSIRHAIHFPGALTLHKNGFTLL